MNEIKIFDDKRSLTKFAAGLFVKFSNEAIESDGKFTVALSGGGTPVELYKLLATDSYAGKINWKNIFIFWSDERVVSATDKENNSYQARLALLDHVNIPPENIFPIPVQYAAAKAAAHYTQTIRSIFHSDLPAFDLIFLGLGEDAHTASLFPRTEILKDDSSLVKEVIIQEQAFHRVSFTAKLINKAKKIIFLVSGPAKQKAVLNVHEANKKAEDFPARLIKGTGKTHIYWLMDKEASALLPKIKIQKNKSN